MASKKKASAKADPQSAVETTPEATALAALGDVERRAWRQWRAQGGDGTWRKLTVTGFVPWARARDLDVPLSLTDVVETDADGNEHTRPTTEVDIDAWAADVLHREPILTQEKESSNA